LLNVMMLLWVLLGGLVMGLAWIGESAPPGVIRRRDRIRRGIGRLASSHGPPRDTGGRPHLVTGHMFR
jgi:hypothetical protein